MSDGVEGPERRAPSNDSVMPVKKLIISSALCAVGACAAVYLKRWTPGPMTPLLAIAVAPLFAGAIGVLKGDRPFRCRYDRLHASNFAFAVTVAAALLMCRFIVGVWMAGKSSFLLGQPWNWGLTKAWQSAALSALCFAAPVVAFGSTLLENAAAGKLGTAHPALRLFQCQRPETNRLAFFFFLYLWMWSAATLAAFYFHYKLEIPPVLIVAGTARTGTVFVFLCAAALLRAPAVPSLIVAMAAYAGFLAPLLGPEKGAVYFAVFFLPALAAAAVDLRTYRRKREWGVAA